MKNLSATRIVKLAAVAAIYVVLTLALGFMSYANIQYRIAEALMLLCFYKKDYGISLILGCFIANLFSPMALDMVFGTAATVLAVLLIYISPNIYIASLAPVVTNAFIVGFELYYFLDLPFWLSCFQVAFGEFVCVSVLGVILFKLFEKNKRFMELLVS
ncbi:MAG TPA: QueT transporter family protein [Candidatus Faeciplasma pullistercoris]|uniref:QueT transporter family protein n=1 Tax=Candidatus Faeciplasma pullistercoris TaxID=2840800 RepID=A0A9D1GS14_9FIRM|nr:QueT transporter family protein [Candidatus Faeciplasma pullistercoris]